MFKKILGTEFLAVKNQTELQAKFLQFKVPEAHCKDKINKSYLSDNT